MKKILPVNNIEEIKYRMNYRINESPRYRPIMEKESEFDNVPTEIYNTDSGMPVPTSPAFTNEVEDELPAPETGSKKPVDTDPSTEEPVLSDPKDNTPISGTPEPPAPGSDMNAPPTDIPQPDPAGMTPQEPLTPEVDNIQNEIIKHNIAAMQAIHDQLQGLNDNVDGLNAQLKLLSADVEEVREPTNTEKLMNKGQVSYPYYFNLNDVWSNNWFNQKRQDEGEKGMKQMPDGTYIADFDDLPQHSKIDVEKSFNDMV